MIKLVKDQFKYLDIYLNFIVSQIEMYKFQARQQKIEREDSSSKYSDLQKVSSYTPGHWKNYIPTEVSHST